MYGKVCNNITLKYVTTITQRSEGEKRKYLILRVVYLTVHSTHRVVHCQETVRYYKP